MKIGFLINPLAGIGGAVALKGSDGQEIVARAISLGGQSQAQSRAAIALSKVTVGDTAGNTITRELMFFTAAGVMGETVLREIDIPFEVIYTAADLSASSTAEDTKNLVRLFVEKAVDLIVFTGGDGTARDVLDVLSCDNDAGIPVIGIPAGVKMHSAVYATTPSFAGGVG